MKHTKENIIKLLRVKKDALLNIAKGTEDNAFADRLHAEAFVLRECISLIEDKDFFNEIAEIWANEIKEVK